MAHFQDGKITVINMADKIPESINEGLHELQVEGVVKHASKNCPDDTKIEVFHVLNSPSKEISQYIKSSLSEAGYDILNSKLITTKQTKKFQGILYSRTIDENEGSSTLAEFQEIPFENYQHKIEGYLVDAADFFASYF